MVAVVNAVTSEKAIAGMAGAVGITLAAPIIGKVPFIGTPMGRIAAGVVIAWLGHRYMDGYASAVLIGIGAGLAAQGIVSVVIPQTVSA